MPFLNIINAEGLEQEDADTLQALVDVYRENEGKNSERKAYYEDKVPVKDLGKQVPESFAKKINTSIGWAAKGVDLLAARSVFDGFVFEDSMPDGLSDILNRNRFAAKYMRILPSELIHGCASWTVGAGDVSRGEPAVIINAYNALSSAMLWDYRHERIKAGFVIADMARFSRSGREIPSMVVMYTDRANIVLTRTERRKWVASYEYHSMGRPLMEAMCNGERDDKPFGRSRISRTAMGIIDSMKRELVYTELQSACYSIPQKYLAGLSEDQYKELVERKGYFYNTELIATTLNEADGVPSIGMLQAASVEPHIAMQDKLANRMAAEFSMPVAAFGVPGNGYTSSDALRASNDDLVMVANSLNAYNGEALKNVCLMAIAVMQGKSFADLDDNELSVSVHWHDTEMLTAAQSADANIKIASVVDGYAGTSMFLERVGFNDAERKRMESELGQARSREIIQQALFNANGE